MKNLFLFIVISFFSISIGYSQDKLKKAPEKIDNPYALINEAKNSLANPQKAFDFIEKALIQSIQNKDKLGEGLSYQVLGMINANLNQNDLAVDYYKRSVSILETLRRKDHLHTTYVLIGDSYFALKDYNNSLIFYRKFLDSSPNLLTGITARYKMADVYEAMSEYPKALATLNEILEIEQDANNKQGIVDVQNRIGKLYSNTNQEEQAIANYQRSAKIAEELPDKKALSNTLKEQGAALRKSGRYDEELKVRQELLDISEEKQDLPSQISENLEIGNIYIEKKETEKAIPYIQRSIELSGAQGLLEEKGKGLQTLSLAFKEQMAFDKALETYKLYVETADEVHRLKEEEIRNSFQLVTSMNRKLERLDLIEKELLLSQQTVDLLRQEQLVDKKSLKAQQVLTYSLTSALIVLLFASGFVYRSGIQKRKANQTLALRSLRSQMNPHFIYNSLNSVNNHISRKDERAANRFLSDFSRLLRAVMENSKHDFVALSSEIEILKLYLFLEHSRFNDKFEYVFNVDPEIDSESFQIPPMLIQPFIENAIWHGLRYRESIGKLEVSVQRSNVGVEITVSDNGIGRKKSLELKTKNQKDHNSTGLLNIKNRISLINQLFDINIEVKIEDQDTEKQSGTIVKIFVPHHSHHKI